MILKACNNTLQLMTLFTVITMTKMAPSQILLLYYEIPDTNNSIQKNHYSCSNSVKTLWCNLEPNDLRTCSPFCSVLATRCGANEQKSKWFMSQRSLLDPLLVFDTTDHSKSIWQNLPRLWIWNLPNVPFQIRPCVLSQIQFIRKIKSTMVLFKCLSSHFKKRWVT